MKDILFEYDDGRIECEVNGLELTYTYSDDPKCHHIVILRDEGSYERLKRDMLDYENDTNAKFDTVWYFLETTQCYQYFVEGEGYVYNDLRERDEIDKYLDEAWDKVWLMRTRPCENPEIEKKRQQGVHRILTTYDDIPKDGYTDWECGYWNGVMGALRWVLGEEKNWLDT